MIHYQQGLQYCRSLVSKPSIQGLLLFLTTLLIGNVFWNLTPDEEVYMRSAEWQVIKSSRYYLSAFGLEDGSFRIFYDHLSAFLTTLLGYNLAKSVGAFLSASLYFLAFARLGKILKVNLLAVTIVLLMVTYHFNQQLYGSYYLTGGFLPKTLAYPLVILGLTFFLEHRFIPFVIFMTLATYLHFLVGGAWFLFLLLVLTLREWRFSPIVKLGLAYGLLVAPLLFLIVQNQTQVIDPELAKTYANLPSVEWIYSEFRASHHLLPFHNIRIFRTDWLPGLIIVITSFFLLLGVKEENEWARDAMRTLLLIVLIQQIVSFGITYFDTNHALAKFNLFRPNALCFLLLCLFGARLLQDMLSEELFSSLSVVIGLVVLPFYAYFYFYQGNLTKIVREWTLSEQIRPLEIFVAEHVPKNAVILVAEKAKPRIEISLKRGIFVDYKANPTGNIAILEWYKRLNYKSELLSKGCAFEVSEYKIDYVLFNLPSSVFKNCSQVVYQDEGFFLVRLDLRH